jgi:hypothetical protein
MGSHCLFKVSCTNEPTNLLQLQTDPVDDSIDKLATKFPIQDFGNLLDLMTSKLGGLAEI